MAGYSQQCTTGYDFAVARYNPDGSLDGSFDGDGTTLTDLGTAGDYGGRSVALDADGRSWWQAFPQQSTTGNDFAVARYNPEGSLDTSFDGDGTALTDIRGALSDNAYGVAIDADGKIVAAGSSAECHRRCTSPARYNPDGSLDTSFDGDGTTLTDFGTAFDDGRSVAIDPDGKIVVAGSSGAISPPPAITRTEASTRASTAMV